MKRREPITVMIGNLVGRGTGMRILITGAGGFVGANLVAELGRGGYATVASHHGPIGDAIKDGLLAVGGPPPEFARCDVTDAGMVDDLVARLRPSHVVHAAAITPDPRTEIDAADRVVATNELGTLAILRAAARHRVERVVLISSSAVYAGGGPEALLDEHAPTCEACGLYAVTKLGAERLCDWATNRLGLDTRIVRLGPVYGPFERPTASRRSPSAVYVAAEVALAGQPLRCQAPRSSRDWIHGRDAARGILAVLLSSSLSHRLYNLAGEAVTLERLLGAVVAAIPTATIEWVAAPVDATVPSNSGPSGFRNMDTGRLRRDTAFRPTIGIEAGVRDTVAWLAAYRAAETRQQPESANEVE